MENNEDKIYSISVLGKQEHFLFIAVFLLTQTNFKVTITQTVSAAIKIQQMIV